MFGKKADATPSPNAQIQKLGDTLEVIEKREEVLNKKIDQEVAKAREATKKGNKTVALTHLKRKKQYEEQANKLAAQRQNIEVMQMKMEEAAMNMETLKAQKEGAKAIQNMYGKTTIDKVDADMDKVREVMENANDISEAIAQPMGVDDLLTDELEEEFAQLEQEQIDKEILGIEGQGMPSVPSGKIGDSAISTTQPAVADEDEEALRQLEAELGA
jgi:charged multivesicular body protein 4